MRKLLVILFLLIAKTALPQNDSSFAGFTVNNFDLEQIQGSKATQESVSTLFIFLSPECPLCQGYIKMLDSIYDQFKSQVSIFGIIPGRAYSAEDIKGFALERNVRFPLYLDGRMKLTHYLQATVTPQVILLDKKNDLLYKGAIDNLLEGLGKRKINATDFYLLNALEQSLSNKLVIHKRTKAVGCKINEF